MTHPPKPTHHVTRRQAIRTALTAAIGIPSLTGLYAWRIEPHWLEIVERPLPLRDLPADLDGRTLAQLSDIHVGPQVDDGYVRDVFRRISRRSPDIVAYTGDLISYIDGGRVDQLTRVLQDMPRGRLATVASLGNHDYGRKWSEGPVGDAVAKALGDAGATVLRNEATMVHGLQLVGLDDLWAKRFSAAAVTAIEPGTPTIALSHNPDSADLDAWDRFTGWILAGHTHGGQCKPPFLPPPLLPVENRRYTAGEFELAPGRHLYVSRGVGHLLKVRFNCRPEVTWFTLRRS